MLDEQPIQLRQAEAEAEAEEAAEYGKTHATLQPRGNGWQCPDEGASPLRQAETEAEAEKLRRWLRLRLRVWSCVCGAAHVELRAWSCACGAACEAQRQPEAVVRLSE